MERKNNLTYIPRSLAVLLIVILLCSVFFTGCTADSTQKEVVIGIAWRADTDSEFYTNIVAAVEEAGGKPVLLDQVKADYLTYDSNNTLVDCTDEVGGLTLESANAIKENLWEGTNVAKHLHGSENAAEFMDRETALLVFEALIDTLCS